VRTEFATPVATVGIFTGRYTVEEGGRLLTARSLPERITGVYLTRALPRSLTASLEVDRVNRDGREVETRLRQSMRWTPLKSLAVSAEHSVMANGRPSFHASVERDGTRFGLTAAYVLRGVDYLAFGPLAGISNRKGFAADGRVRLTRRLDVDGYLTDLQPGAPRPTTVTHARQYGANATLKPSDKIQFSFNHNASGAVSSARAWWQISDSIGVNSAYRNFSTRLRIENIRAGETTRVWAVELEEERTFKRGFSLSGRARWQQSSDPARHVDRLSTGIRGAFRASRQLSFAAETDLSGEFRNTTWMTTSGHRNASVSMSVALAPLFDARFEYGTSQQFYTPYLGPTVTASHQNTFFIRLQRTMR